MCVATTGRLIVCALVLLALGGCSGMRYYMQAIGGQLDIVTRMRPVDEMIADPATPAAVRDHLRQAVDIRNFASSVLGLPDNRSYRFYARLGRSHVLWNVVATDEFSMQPRAACFPIAGCVSYRGFFAESAAADYAGTLRQAGGDVAQYGVAAYSTLGWFNDPLLDTFLLRPRAELARLLFHELAHQQLYLGGDTAFDESFATAVEEEGVARWLAANRTETERRSDEILQQRRAVFLALVMRYRERLATVYAAGAGAASMREAKQALFTRMREDYQQVRQCWGGWSGYDHWFAQDLNNAHLAALTSYTDWVGAFRQLLRDEGGDLPRFYARARDLARSDPDERLATLIRLESRQSAPLESSDPAPCAP